VVSHMERRKSVMTQQQKTTLMVLGGLGVVLLVAAIYIGQAFKNNPLNFVFYAAVAVVVIIGVRIWMPSAKKTFCPSCGKAMMTTNRVVFPESFNAETQEQLPPIFEKRYHCQSCNYRFFEVEAGDPEAPELERYWVYQKDKTRPTISVEEWENIKAEAAKAASEKSNRPESDSSRWMY
jgi:hypothetical protein